MKYRCIFFLFSHQNYFVNASLPSAPVVDFIQTDWDYAITWSGKTFCADKEIYALDINGDKK